jgi:hypothetical protein
MAHAGWKWNLGMIAASAVLSASSVAAAQPQDVKALPRLVLPKIDVHAQADASKPLTVINPATAATVAKILDAMHRQDVAAATVLPPAPSRLSPAAAVVTKERIRPVKSAAIVVEPKPVRIVQVQTGVDSHALVGEVPGIQIRMPWRIP